MKRIWNKPIPPNAQIMYRAEANIYAHHDDDLYAASTSCRLEIYKYHVVRKTPCGYFVARYQYGPMHFIRDDAKKRFAWPTKNQAIESLIARKEREIQHLEQRLEDARRKLNAALFAAA